MLLILLSCSCLYSAWILQLGSSLSIYGCRKYQSTDSGNANDRLDAERGTYVAPSLGDSSEASNLYKNVDTRERNDAHETAGAWVYIFQIIYQVHFCLPESSFNHPSNLGKISLESAK